MKTIIHILLCVVLLIVSASVSAQGEQLVEKVSQLSAENATLKAELRSVSAKYKRDSAKVVQLTAQLSEKNQALLDTKKELQEQKSSTSVAKITAAEKKAEAAEKRAAAAEKKAADLQVQLDKANSEYGSMVANKDAEIARKNTELSVNATAIANMTEMRDQAEKKAEAYKQQLSTFINRDVENWQSKAFNTYTKEDLEAAITSYEKIGSQELQSQINALRALSGDYDKYTKAVQVLRSKYVATDVAKAKQALVELLKNAKGDKYKGLQELNTNLGYYKDNVEEFQNFIKKVNKYGNDFSTLKDEVFNEENRDEDTRTMLEDVEAWKTDAPWLYDEFGKYYKQVGEAAKQGNISNILSAGKAILNIQL